MMNNKIKSVAAVLVMASMGVVGCTQTREASFPDGAGENIFEKSLFESAQISVETDSETETLAVGKLSLASQARGKRVRSVQAPESLKSMFKGLELQGKSESKYGVRFQLDRGLLTAFKAVREASELSVQEQQISAKSASGELLVPVFQYRIQAYGQVVRAKNDLGEQTSTLRLQPTEWKVATHIQVSTLPEDRIGVAAPSADIAERIFLRDRVDGQVFTRGELTSQLDIRVSRGEAFEAEVDGADLALNEVVSFSSDSVTEAQREMVRAQDRGAPKRGEIQRCGEKLLAKLPAKIEDCVVIARYRVAISHVEAKRRVADQDGSLSAEIEFRAAPSSNGSKLVQISRDPLVSEVGTVSVDSRRSLKVSQLKNVEFLYRRTLEDSPNSFDYTFAGSSGPLEIVKFSFEKDRVRIVRADPMAKSTGSNAIDLQDLMSLSAQYMREVTTDANGNRLAKPRLVSADPTHPDAVAFVEWERNSVPPVSSALDYYNLGQCFIGPTDVSVSEVDHRMDASGVLNFSVTSSYVNNPGTDCANVMQADYFDTVQTSFAFKERVSLKRYVKGDEKPLLSVPYSAQKKLGFGLFTYKRNEPNKYGNTGIDGTEVALPALFDVQGGKKIRYVLSGLPSASGAEGADAAEVRARVRKATEEVVADWNAAFRKALKGTPMARAEGAAGDVIELMVEGDSGVAPSQMGDLDVNHIYYVQKMTSSGVIGLGGSHPNPRSGRVEAGNVFIYGGNILSYVEYLREMEKARQAEKAVGGAVDPAAPATPAGLVGMSGTAELKVQSHPGHASVASSLKSQGEKILSLKGVDSTTRMAQLKGLTKNTSQLAFMEAYQAAARESSLGNPQAVERFVSEKMLEVLAGKRPASELARLKHQVKRAQNIHAVMDQMHKSGVCVRTADQTGSAVLAQSTKEKSDLDLLVAVYKPTLAHEMGHNLGLRHNFIGSFDKANFKFSADENTERNYSSIMDYLEGDHDSYDGLGPYDVAAIRAGYAGVIELQDGSLASIEGVKRALGLKSWLELDAGALAKLPLKKYMFCSDEEAGQNPTCNRFDRGTTPSEIVDAIIEDYRSNYELTNFAGNRLRFTWWANGGYIGRLFGKFTQVRQFLEETLFQAVGGADQATISAYAQAAFKGMDFFHSVVRTPDAPAMAVGNERYAAVKAQDGTVIPVERKWLKDVALDDQSDRLRVRGVEFDKVVALIMLTERNLGFPRYERASLKTSYPEFERMVISDAKSALDLPTVRLVSEVLSNRIQPAAVTAKGMMGLNGGFKAETTEMLRFYALLGGIANLDVDGLEAKDNSSRLFRVMSAFSASKKVVSVVRPGASSEDRDQLKYWAPMDAEVSGMLVQRASDLGALTLEKDALIAGFKAWLSKKAELEATPETDAEKKKGVSEEVAKIEAQLTEVLAKLPVGAGSKDVAQIGDTLQKIVAMASDLRDASDSMPPRRFALILDQQRTMLESLAANVPTLGVAMRAISAESTGNELVDRLMPGSVAEFDQGTIFSNLETINRVLLQLHPELRR